MKKRSMKIKQPKEQRITVGQLAADAHQAKDYAKAEELYLQLLRDNPKKAPLLSLIGQLYIEMGKTKEAMDYLNKSLEIDDSLPYSHSRLGYCFQLLRDYEAAEKEYQKALSLDPNNISALNNISSIYCEDLDFENAEKYLTRLLELEPEHPNGLGNLGTLRLETGNVPEGLELISRAIEANPEQEEINSNYVFDLMYDDHPADEIFQAHLQWASKHASKTPASPYEFNRKYEPNKKLRIGYISPDFKQHSVSYFFVPILKSHDKNKFEIFCYQDSVESDDLTQHLMNMSDHWRKTAELSDTKLIKLIDDDQIDIIVELAGHTAHNRQKMLSERVAPIQISYLGYPATTGLKTIDYRITDEWADPEGESDSQYTEKLVRLPSGFLCYQPPSNIDEPGSIPFDRNGYITFGSFNVLQKISDRTLKHWAAVLNKVPGSKLLLKARGLRHPKAQQRLYERLGTLGIDKDRVNLLPPTNGLHDHLRTYSKVDIALDTVPYNGTTTTCEALWMGVPVVTLIGDSHRSRVGYSIMQQAGLTELAATSDEHFIAVAVDLARQPDLLRHLRTNLRPHLQASKLCDSNSISKDLETTFTQFWNKLCEMSPKKESQTWIKPENSQPTLQKIYQSLPPNKNTPFTPYKFLASEEVGRDLAVVVEHSQWYPRDAKAASRLISSANKIIDLDPNAGEFISYAAKCAKAEQQLLATSHPNNAQLLQRNIGYNCPITINIEVLPEISSDLLDNDTFLKISDINTFQDILPLLDSAKSKPAVILYSKQAGIQLNDQLFIELEKMGYFNVKYIPIANAFTPVDGIDESRDSVNHTYLVHKTAVQKLAQNNVLIELAQDAPPGEIEEWHQTFSKWSPFPESFMNEWIETNSNSPEHDRYIQGLSLFLSALASSDESYQYTLSLKAYKLLIRSLEASPNIPRLFTTARVTSELGLYENCLSLLEMANEILNSEPTFELDEPFLSPNSEFDSIDPQEDIAGWCLASVLCEHLQLSAPTLLDMNEDNTKQLITISESKFCPQFITNRMALLENKAKVSAGTNIINPIENSEKKITASKKEDIAIIYHLARTGGTLISKCLGCIPGNYLLSELHPLISVANPIQQAQDYFHLFNKNELNQLMNNGNYLEAIKEIQKRVADIGGKLIIRDWSHIDFTATPFVNRRSNQLSQTLLLKDSFNIRQLATVRHPIDSYISLAKLPIMQGKLNLPDYLAGAKEFALKAKEIGFYRYEDFCRNPNDILKNISNSLGTYYNDSFLENFYNYENITGETAGGRSSHEIIVPPRPKLSKEEEKHFKDNGDYWEILELLGYPD